MILHWNLTLVGGFLGTYAILLHAGNFGSAQTGNVMEMAAALTGKNFAEVGIRFLAFLIFGSAIVISYLLTNFTKLDMRKLVLWVDAAGLTVTAMMPEGMSAVVSLYPIFSVRHFSGAVIPAHRGITVQAFLLRIILNSRCSHGHSLY